MRHKVHTAKRAVTDPKPDQEDINIKMWQAINSIVSGTQHLWDTDLKKWFPVLDFTVHNALAELNAARFVMTRLIVYLLQGEFKALRTWVTRQLQRLAAQVRSDYRQLVRLILFVSALAYQNTMTQTGIERRAREREVAKAEAQARRELRALHQIIEREAVSGYRLGYSHRLGVISDLADLLVTYSPEVRGLVGELVSGILDLATIDDPLVRIGLSFVLRHIIDRLGIDKVIGALLDRLLQPLLDGGRPHDLHGVIADISGRLNALEQQWAVFMADGGVEVEQAGEEWKELSSPITQTALLAFAGTAAADPAGWAGTISTLLGPILTGPLTAVADAIGKAE